MIRNIILTATYYKRKNYTDNQFTFLSLVILPDIDGVKKHERGKYP